MKQAIEQLIEKLMDKSIIHIRFNFDKDQSHPILIGDVLKKIDLSDDLFLVRHWRLCGFTKSLQEIFSETKFVKYHSTLKPMPIHGCLPQCEDLVPKQESHKAFWSFLINLNL